MAGPAALQRFNLPILHGLMAKGELSFFGFRLPFQISDLVHRTQFRLGMTMTFQTERHAERFRVIYFIHLINAPVTFHATDAARDVNGVIEINEVRHLVDLHPFNRLAARRAFTNERQTRIVFEHLIVAIHASGTRRNIGEPGFVHAGMTVTAIKTELSRVRVVRKRDGLDRLVADARVLGREVIPHPRRHRGADEHNADNDQDRQPVGPLWKNR